MRSNLLLKFVAFELSIWRPIFNTSLINWYRLMVSFCCNLFKSEFDFAKLLVDTIFLFRSEKFTSCVITSHNLYKDCFGNAFLKPLKYSISMLEAFKQASFERDL